MRIEKLATHHELAHFDCGIESLNDFLQRYALLNERGGGCRTYVAHENEWVAGFYSLATGSVAYEDATSRVRKGMAHHRIPTLTLGRLAVDRTRQGSGLGRQLLRNAFAHAAQAAEVVGIRALLVQAKDEEARRWYLANADFEPTTPDPLQLMILMKDIRRMLP